MLAGSDAVVWTLHDTSNVRQVFTDILPYCTILHHTAPYFDVITFNRPARPMQPPTSESTGGGHAPGGKSGRKSNTGKKKQKYVDNGTQEFLNWVSLRPERSVAVVCHHNTIQKLIGVTGNKKSYLMLSGDHEVRSKYSRIPNCMPIVTVLADLPGTAEHVRGDAGGAQVGVVLMDLWDKLTAAEQVAMLPA